MTFASLGYLTFLLLFLPPCQWTPPQYRFPILGGQLLLLRLLDAKYSLLMLASTLLSFWGASWAAPGHRESLRRLGLFVRVILNLAILAASEVLKWLIVQPGASRPSQQAF